MMEDSWWPAIIVLSFLFVLLCWWLSGFTIRNARSHEAYRISVQNQRKANDEQLAIYRQSVEASETSNRLQAEQNELLRELVTVLRQKHSSELKPSN